jgi:uncharacterized protein (DUF2249 family)
MKEITMDTKVSDLLENYEGMKDLLISINPKFKKLNNPILRRTLAKVAGVKQAAIVGGMEPLELLNRLRVAYNQEPIKIDTLEESKKDIEPKWIEQEVKESMDANEVLDNEDNPLAKAFNILRKFDIGDILAIKSDFKPQPLIDEFEKNGYEVYCKKNSDNEFTTYVKKV